MAENLGSLEFDVSVNNANANKILEEVADKLKETADAAKDASDALDDATKEIVDAVKDIKDETDDLSDTANDAADAQEQLADTLSETASAADDAAKATDDLNKSLDPEPATAQAEALSDIAESAETATEATTDLSEATADNSDITKEWTENVFELTKQLAELIRKGEGESETAEDIRANLEQLLQANQDLAANPPFTEEQKDILREYRDELKTLNGAMEEADTSNAADAAEELTDALADAAEETEELTDETTKGGKAAKSSGGLWQWLGKILGVKLPAGATAAKFAIEALKMALSAGLLTVITLLSEAIMKLVDKLTFAFRMQGQLNSKVASSTAEAIAQLKLLQSQWKSLGDDFQSKSQFIEDNQEAFNKLGISIKSVNDAEKLLVKNTNSFVNAIMARARASAAQELMQERMKDSIEDLADAQSKLSKANQGIKQVEEEIANYKHSDADPNDLRLGFLQTRLGNVRSDAARAQREYDKIIAEIEKDSKGLVDVITQSNADAEKAYADLGLSQSEELKQFRDNLKAKAEYYKKYQSDLNSSDKELSGQAAFILNLEKTQNGFNDYLGYLKNLREEVRNDANKLAIVNEEISRLTQKNKGASKTVPNTQDELTYYEKLKLALKEVNAQREQGYKPDPAIVKNLKEQIELYEKANGIYDYSSQIARYREFAEKLVEIEQKKKDRIAEIRADQDLGETERESAVADVVRFSDHDIELLKSEYNIVGDDLAQSVLDGMTTKLEESEEDIVARIIQLRQQLATLSAQGSLTDNSAQIATLSAQLKAATDAYTKMKDAANDSGKAAKKANDQLKDKAAYDRLKKGVTECANSFKTLGQEIGGAAGESLEFIGDLTANVMGTITAIQTYANMTSETIKGVGIATATAIRTVEAASVILAIISAAMQIAMQLVNMFKKDEETYEEKKQVYDAYIDTLDTLIERERKLTETLTAQDAALSFSKIEKYYKDKIKVERESANAYLQDRERGEHSNWYKLQKGVMTDEDARNIAKVVGWDSAAIYKETGGIASRYSVSISDLLNLTGDELKDIQEQAYETYAKLPSELREAIEAIIEADEALNQLRDDTRAQATGTSRESFVDSFKDSLYDLDITAEKVADNIHEYLRKALILDLYKKDYQDQINEYYSQWGDAMADGILTDDEEKALNELENKITNGLEEKISAINERFNGATEETEGGLSGAIKNASQESIDLLAGQTNAVRMNQVEGMALARESLDAVMQIYVQVTLCAGYLRSINTAVNATSDNRSQGIV